ncbi:hypothetical protein BO82DRAFT_81441 [Aspergillus uvarum CBS 121591]|uniref:Uncharacterized protein n=1 Tax=Aspergillus uvarum CBS 121591 TaxID=1448315 RepID=A0A319CDU0_9EURO|nr:hypothetical protein BO82DRAFT_81441 [Aspergillus uvarum CBS 121591]PYH81547.1 hypothetical protein BO82DRAFT_81441 [Aspergillus uvarum CBS 121591]
MQVRARSSHVVPRPLPRRVSLEPSWAKFGQGGLSASLLLLSLLSLFLAQPTLLGAMTQFDPVLHSSFRFEAVSCDAMMVNAFAMETTMSAV